MSIKKIKIKPNGIVFFEGTARRIPEGGAEVFPSIYYRRLINDGSIEEITPQKKEVKTATKKVAKKAAKKVAKNVSTKAKQGA